MSGTSGLVQLPNIHLSPSSSNYLFHLDIVLGGEDIRLKFGDVKFVCVGGTRGRMRALALHLVTELNLGQKEAEVPFDYVFENDRYSGYKVGPVFCISHGIGTPSLSIMLHETFKLLQAAQCSGVTLFRLGTCGGIGIPDGTVVVSRDVVTVGMKSVFRTSSLGELLELPIVVDQTLVNDICLCGKNMFDVISAKTFCSDDFYQGQGRLDGSFCEYSDADKTAFLRRLHDDGIRNIEMESAGVLAMAHKVGIKAAVVCVSLVDRLRSDSVTVTADEIKSYENRPLQLVTKYIGSKLDQIKQ